MKTGIYRSCLKCSKPVYIKPYQLKTKKYCSKPCMYAWFKETGIHVGTNNSFYGKKHSEATKQYWSEIRRGKPNYKIRGSNSPFWRGGVSQVNRTERENIMRSLEYRSWRRNVFERDDYTCQICGKRGGELNADHIKSFALYPELRFDLSNGRALCIPCHRKTDTYSRKVAHEKEYYGYNR